MSSVDAELFTGHEGGQLRGMVVVHVDDFLWSDDDEFQSTVITTLKNIFAIGKKETKYLVQNFCF